MLGRPSAPPRALGPTIMAGGLDQGRGCYVFRSAVLTPRTHVAIISRMPMSARLSLLSERDKAVIVLGSI